MVLFGNNYRNIDMLNMDHYVAFQNRRIFKIRPLSEVSLVNMFSHTVGSLFILMLFYLDMQKLFILMRSHLFILSFMSLALGDVSVRMLPCGMSEIFLPMFSSRTFVVS